MVIEDAAFINNAVVCMVHQAESGRIVGWHMPIHVIERSDLTAFVAENQSIKISSCIEIGNHNRIWPLNIHVPRLAGRLAHLGPAQLFDLCGPCRVRTLSMDGVQEIDPGTKSFDAVSLFSGCAGKRPPFVGQERAVDLGRYPWSIICNL